MSAATVSSDAKPRPSQVIAEALVERQSPCEIVARADRLGLPCQLTQAMLAVCCATAVEAARVPKLRFVPATQTTSA